jgi:hypothetical protein
MTEQPRHTTERVDSEELQSLADEARIDVIIEKLAQQRDAEDNEYYLADQYTDPVRGSA